MLHSFRAGQILLDKYRVERVLGAGGMGVVVAARHLALDELVAIKFMLGGGTPAELSRFVREARAAVRLRSQHVARVLDVAALEDGTPYMVLEYLDGKDLADVVRERGTLPVEEAADAILQACEAIAEAHSIGIVHRDIKPANLFLTRALDGAPCVKVLDFGIAKWANANTAKMEPSQVMGSAPYMAPEQFSATNLIDGRTDVWALGATLFHLLTGKMPFHHDNVDSIQSMMHAVLNRPPMRPRVLRPELSEALEALLLRCLEKDQGNRFPNVAALAAALAPFGPEHATMYSRRAARVLGEPAAPHQAPQRAAPAATAPLAALTAPLPKLGDTDTSTPDATAPLPRLEANENHAAARTASVTGSGVLAVPPPAGESTPTNNRRGLVFGVIGIVAVLAATLLLGGIRLGRDSTTPNAPAVASEPPPRTASPAQLEPTAPSPAREVVTTNIPARIESAPAASQQRSAPLSPRRPAPASPTSSPSSTSPPKEELYGRRR